MASSQETPADIIPENQESEQPESEESSEAFNCEGLDHCYDTEDNLDRHLSDGEWSQCDHIVCPHNYSGSTNFELSEWALYPAHWQESLEFSTWFLSRGLLPEPHNLTALPVDTGLNSWVPSVAASACHLSDIQLSMTKVSCSNEMKCLLSLSRNVCNLR